MPEREDVQFVPRVAAFIPDLRLELSALAEGLPLREVFPELGLDGQVETRFPLAASEPSAVAHAMKRVNQVKGAPLPKWSEHVWITPKPDDSAAEVVERLRTLLEGREATVFVEPEGYPASGVSPGDPLSQHQGYLRPAPTGVDAVAAWSRAGGKGEGATLWVIEQAYPDVKGKIRLDDIGRPLGVEHGESCHHDPAVLASNRKHGARTLGVLAAAHGQGDFAGLAPDARLRLVCERPGGCAGRCCPPELADTLLWIATEASPGDIVLIESQIKIDDSWLTDRFPADVAAAGGDPSWFAPVEVDPAVHDAIRFLTDLGISVIEPAGNGGLELQTIATEGLVVFGRRESSGAVMVGAADSESRQPRDASNRGARIDCYAWGDSVGTISWSPFTHHDGLTTNYSGTSAASAIIAGCAAALQGAHYARTGQWLSPAELRRLLANPETGTPSVDSAGVESTETVGVMPDLAAVLERLEQPTGSVAGSGRPSLTGGGRPTLVRPLVRPPRS